MVRPMTILQVLVIAQIGNAIIVDMNGLPQYLNGQEGINVLNAIINQILHIDCNLLIYEIK